MAEPITSRIEASIEFESAETFAEANQVVERCREQPFYRELVDRMDERFPLF